MTTIEELERELDQFHKNIAESNKLIETINAVIEAIKAQKQDFSERSVALSKLIEAVPGVVEEKNAAAITEFYRQMLEAISKEHKVYIDNIDQYVHSLESMKGGLAEQQGAFLEKLDATTATFSQECEVYRGALASVKSELLSETNGTMNAITAENARICENYLQKVKALCDETKAGFESYTLKLEQLTAQFAETEKKTAETIANAERSISDLIEESKKSYREISDSISQSTERLLLEIKVYIEHLERQNESLVKSIEEKFNNSIKSIQNENAQVMEKLNQIQAAQKKGMLLTGIGIAVLAVLCILGFFL